ncbi:hypothetical protein Tco_0861785 [Tanacetum coccineum]
MLPVSWELRIECWAHEIMSSPSTTFDGPAVEVKDGIIASAWNLVHRSLTFAEFSSLSGIVPSTANIKDYVELADGKNIEVGTII